MKTRKMPIKIQALSELEKKSTTGGSSCCKYIIGSAGQVDTNKRIFTMKGSGRDAKI